jgi:hypothetical protein
MDYFLVALVRAGSILAGADVIIFTELDFAGLTLPRSFTSNLVT